MCLANISQKISSTQKEEELHSKVELNKNYLENKSLLVNDFGTNKSRKVMESMKGNIVKEENISAPKAMQDIIIKNTLEEENQAKINQQNGVNKSEENFKNILPPFNSKTKDVSLIFNLESSKYNYLLYKFIISF